MPWWENESIAVRGGRLFLGGRSAESLARAHGTPLFVYGADRLKANYRRLEAGFAAVVDREIRVCYAMKANAHPGLLALLRGEGSWIDAVSPGEVKAALAAGFPAGRILFTGTSVSRRDLEEVFVVEGLVVNIDAPEQLALMRIARPRRSGGRRVRVSVRWNPGFGRGFNPKVVTAGARSGDGTPIKFGVEDRKVLDVFRAARESGFDPVGLHQHLGSGWVRADYPAVLEAVDKLAVKAAQVEAAGFALEFVDIGGGFGPRYIPGQGLFPVERYARAVIRSLRQAGVRAPALVVEPGKFLAADAGVLLLRVVYAKESFGNLFACVDGGTFNTLPRPAIYASAHHVVIDAGRVAGGPRRRVTVAGHLCETGDIFAKDVLLPCPETGRLLAVLNAGAYGRSMASNFNQRPIPPEIIV